MIISKVLSLSYLVRASGSGKFMFVTFATIEKKLLAVEHSVVKIGQSIVLYFDHQKMLSDQTRE
jgi:uncharacterized protein (DUF302 family)